jgi:hypothetical protein
MDMNVTCMERKAMHLGLWREIQKSSGHYEDLDVGGWIILKFMLKKCNWFIMTGFVWLKIEIIGRIL